MNRILQTIFVVLTLYASVTFAQSGKQEDITDKNQLFNRTDWRIQNINLLVNKWQTDNEYRLISYETDKLARLMDIAVKNFTPLENKDAFIEITDSIKTLCSEIGEKAVEKKHDDIIEKSNELFKKYTEFKLSLKEIPVEELQ